ncbi:hypothetical protein HHI36_014814 [Cryptolaemus montrouzieri]|uniref:G-protein coupled receptors family 1 profile domain-containing protein n=1 Tax=Cryptolaemus montrouzieri TaxID=559131 RepID=A0ABD2N3P4_9CUCU
MIGLQKVANVGVLESIINDLHGPNLTALVHALEEDFTIAISRKRLQIDCLLISRPCVFLGLTTGWIVSLVLCIPPFLKIAPYGYIQGPGSCTANHRYGKSILVYSAIYTLFTLLIPAFLIICCNLKVLMIARYHRHRIASAIYEVTLSAQVTITHQRNPFFVPTITAPNSGGPPKFKGKSAIHTVFQLLGSFLVFYFPYYLLIIWQALSETVAKSKRNIEVHPFLYPLASALLITSIPVNAFLYGVKNKTLRKTFQNYLRKKQTKSEVNQEIQARTPSTCGSRRPSLTPLGFFSRPTLQRRLSEALLDVQKTISSPQKSKIKRIASDIAWRPYSNSSLNISQNEEIHGNIKQTTSCNTLQVPADIDTVSVITQDEPNLKLVKCISPIRSSTAQLILQKLFTVGDPQDRYVKTVRNALESSPKRSPRIMITRAFSEESEKSNPNTPSKNIISKKHSSSTSLLEKKWRQMKFKYGETDTDGRKPKTTIKPLLDNNDSGNRDSDSSENSDSSSGKLFICLENKRTVIDREPNEDHLLSSWPLQKNLVTEDLRRKKLLKRTLVDTHEIVL